MGWDGMGWDGMDPRVMRELADELVKPLFIIYQQSWLTGEVPDDWKLVSVMSIGKKCGREDPGNYRPVSLTSVPGKVTHLVDVGRTVDVVYLDFSKAFDTVSHSTLLDELTAVAWTGALFAGLGTGWMAGPREWW
ncbi:hypothetical protein DUI87_07031 [Hirundo rustica rustica]|uniref:Reverse transcriptase domain-containing protein n=1 Tax=Hirundo rustica rustica TaxID=333673 RepID=A0A3M0KP16_HIRRU|nr:hypothetical protein DUI87_07031 [Hirundo rustica rustica]